MLVDFVCLVCDFNLAELKSEIELLEIIFSSFFFVSVCCILSLRLDLAIDISVKCNLEYWIVGIFLDRL